MHVPSYIIFPFNSPDLADTVLFEFFDICRLLDIPAFICFGTALGFYRSGSYLPGDPDIDVFALCPACVIPVLKGKLSSKGYVISSIPGADPSLNFHTVKNNIILDIWFHQRNSFEAFYQGSDFITYKNHNIRIPFNIEKYLTTVYGDWKTPSNTRAICYD